MVVIFFASLGRLGMATLWISTGVQRSEANGPLAHGKRGDGGHRRVLGHAYVQPGGGEGERDCGDASELTAAHGACHGDADL
tara:strand:- start:153 stop:398 length:246 start_codon:yes stop_codon:yes gene_type:complete